MADEFEQFKRKADTGDDFAQYQRPVVPPPPPKPIGDQPATPMGVARTMGSQALEAGKGAIKGIGRSIADTGSMVFNPFGQNPVANYIESKTGIGQKIHNATEPANLPQRIGSYIPDVAMAIAAPETAGKLLPNVASAGRKFDIVQGAMKGLPVNIDAAAPAALRADELRRASFARPPILKNVLERLSPGANPSTFRETTDLGSAAGKLSAQENMRITPAMQRQVDLVSKALKDSNQAAADANGVGDIFRSANNEYRRAMKIQGVKDKAGELAKTVAAKAVAGAAGGGIGGYLGYKLAKQGLGGD